MKVRIVESTAGRFIAERQDSEHNSWSPITKAFSEIEEAEEACEAWLAKRQQTVEYNKRKAEGRHIIKEWEV